MPFNLFRSRRRSVSTIDTFRQPLLHNNYVPPHSASPYTQYFDPERTLVEDQPMDYEQPDPQAGMYYLPAPIEYWPSRNPSIPQGRKCYDSDPFGDWHLELQNAPPDSSNREDLWRLVIFGEHQHRRRGYTLLSLSLDRNGSYYYLGPTVVPGNWRYRDRPDCEYHYRFATLNEKEMRIWERAAGKVRLRSSMDSYQWCCAIMDEAIRKGAFTAGEKDRCIRELSRSLEYRRNASLAGLAHAAPAVW